MALHVAYKQFRFCPTHQEEVLEPCWASGICKEAASKHKILEETRQSILHFSYAAPVPPTMKGEPRDPGAFYTLL